MHVNMGGGCNFLHTFQSPAFRSLPYRRGSGPTRHGRDAGILLPPIMRAIQATGYEGFVGHEFIPKGEPIAALKQALELCDVWAIKTTRNREGPWLHCRGPVPRRS